MVKKKRTIYLTQEQYDAIKKFEEEGHRDALNVYSGQTYNYGHNDGNFMHHWRWGDKTVELFQRPETEITLFH